MKFLRKFVTVVDNLNEKVGKGVSWLTAILVLVVCFDVFTRYVLNKSSIAVPEMEWHLFAVIFLIGAAYTLKHDRHVRVDVLYLKFSAKTKAWINLLGSLIFLIPLTIVVIISSKNFVLNSFRVNETSPDPGGLPARYLLKAAIPLAFLLLLLQGVSLAMKSLFKIIDDQKSAKKNAL